MCALGILAVQAAGIVLDLSLRSIYLFTWYPLAALCAVLLARRTRRQFWQLPLILLMAANLCVTYLPSVQKSLDPPQTIIDEAAQWLVDQDSYDYLYGPWATVNYVAARTDGAVLAGCWTDDDFTVLGYINPQNIYSAEDNQRAVYLVTADQRGAFLALAEQAGAGLREAASFADGELTFFTSTVPLLHPQVPPGSQS